MLDCSITNVKPWRQFIIDFCEQFEKMCQDANQLTLLMLDANKCISTPEKDSILDLVEGYGYKIFTNHFTTTTKSSQLI
jgi:hypothetical protein